MIIIDDDTARMTLTGFPGDVIEMSRAHAMTSGVRHRRLDDEIPDMTNAYVKC